MQMKSSKILDGYSLVVMYPTDQNYEEIKPLFERYGLALTDVRSNVFYIDGNAFDEENYDDTHLTTIDAHESAHIILGHGGETISPLEETEADYLAILLLDAISQTESSNILKDNFSARHGISFEEAKENIRPEMISKIESFMGENFGEKNDTEEIITEFFDMLINEKVEKAKMLLFEGRVDDARKYATSKGVDKHIFDELVVISKQINSNQKYLDWIVKRFVDEKIKTHDEVRDKIEIPLYFFQSHHSDFTKKDINTYATTADLVNAVEEIKKKERRSFSEKLPGEKILENESVIIMAPTTIGSSCYYGSGTTWCTTDKDRDYFDKYTRSGQLYYILSKVKTTDDPTYKVAVRFEFTRSKTGYKIAEIRDAQNTGLSEKELHNLINDDVFNVILSDLTKRREMEIRIYSFDRLEELYKSDPVKFLKDTPYDLLFESLREIGIIKNGAELCGLLIENGIHPLTKTQPVNLNQHYYNYLYLKEGSITDNVIVTFVDESLTVLGTSLSVIFSWDIIGINEMIRYYKVKYPENINTFLVKFIGDMLSFYDVMHDRKFDFFKYYGDIFTSEAILGAFNGIDNLADFIKEKGARTFNEIFTDIEKYKLRDFFSRSISGGANIIDLYNVYQKYKTKHSTDIFQIITPYEWITGFTKMYDSDLKGIQELVPFLLKNDIDIFEYLDLSALSAYYGDNNKAIDAAKDHYTSEDGDIEDGRLAASEFLDFLKDSVKIKEQIEYFKSKNADEPLLAMIETYGDKILDYTNIPDLESAVGEDAEYLLKVFTAAGYEDLFLENAGQLRMFKIFAEKISSKDVSPEDQLKYRRKAFDITNMSDVRMNENGTVDLICEGYKDFEDWFYDGEIGYSHANPKYVAEKIFGEDYWEPYYDVVSDSDWIDTVWDNVNDEGQIEIRKYIVEEILGVVDDKKKLKTKKKVEVKKEKISIDVEDNDLDEEKYAPWIKKDKISEGETQFYLTPNRLKKIDNDDLGKIISEDDQFDDLKNNLKWAYESAYNNAASGEWYEAYVDDIFDILSTKEVRWEKTGRMNKVTRKDKSTYEYEEQIFVIANISFFDNVMNWVDDNIGYNEEFQYSSFIDTVQNYLSESSNLLSPDPSEWPDDKNVRKYFNEELVDRIWN